MNKCDCGGALVPMRYVAICAQGSHIQDIPWFKWAHRGHDAGVTEEVRFCRAYKELRFVRYAKMGEGLKALSIDCSACKRSRSLAELVMRGLACARRDQVQRHAAMDGRHGGTDRANTDLLRFSGEPPETTLPIVYRPWIFPRRRPTSHELADAVRGHVYFEKVVADNGGPQAQMVAEWIAAELATTPGVRAAGRRGGRGAGSAPLLDLKDGEWAAFLKKIETGRDRYRKRLRCRRLASRRTLESWPSSLTSRSGFGQVQRVREVRALLGFRRHSAVPTSSSPTLGPISVGRPIYPAVEMFGEGIFLRFDEVALQEWERLPEVQARAEILVDAARDEWAHRLDVPEPRFIALHTISHLLMRRLAFDSGYSSASLQERIYANTDRQDRDCWDLDLHGRRRRAGDARRSGSARRSRTS